MTDTLPTTHRPPSEDDAPVPPIRLAWIPLRQIRDLAEVAGRRAQMDQTNREFAPQGLRIAPRIGMPGSRWVQTATMGWVAVISSSPAAP